MSVRGYYGHAVEARLEASSTLRGEPLTRWTCVTSGLQTQRSLQFHLLGRAGRLPDVVAGRKRTFKMAENTLRHDPKKPPKLLREDALVYHCWGTGAMRQPAGGWLERWRRELELCGLRGDAPPIVCCEKGCARIATVGAHVEHVHGPFRSLSSAVVGFRSKWYIVPTCSTHNNWRTMNGTSMRCKEVYALRVHATRNERIAAALLGYDMRQRHK